jgi:hypothetical protein
LDQGVVGALDQGQDGVLYGKTSWEGNERKRCECWSEGEGWKEEDRGRSWCLGQAFLTKFSLGGESTGSRKSAQGGEGGSWERQRRVARANTALPDGQTTRRPDYQTTRLPDYQTARLLGYRRPDCQTTIACSRAYGLVSRSDGSLDTQRSSRKPPLPRTRVSCVNGW